MARPIVRMTTSEMGSMAISIALPGGRAGQAGGAGRTLAALRSRPAFTVRRRKAATIPAAAARPRESRPPSRDRARRIGACCALQTRRRSPAARDEPRFAPDDDDPRMAGTRMRRQTRSAARSALSIDSRGWLTGSNGSALLKSRLGGRIRARRPPRAPVSRSRSSR